MSVSSYTENGKVYWKFFLHLRTKRGPKRRVQRRGEGFESESEALAAEAEVLPEAQSVIKDYESQGYTWEMILLKWRAHYAKFESPKFCETVRMDYEARVTNYAPRWLNKPVAATTMADAYELMQQARRSGITKSNFITLKSNLRTFFNFGLSQRLIPHGTPFPFDGIDAFEEKKPEKQQLILKKFEILKLVKHALDEDHRWSPVWFFDLHTGLRSGELCGLRKSDLELITTNEARALEASKAPNANYGFIRVERQWNSRLKKLTQTKGRYARNVPINRELYWYLQEYLPKAKWGSDEMGERLFEFLPEWRSREQAKVIKAYCEDIGLPSITFHTLRACFATQLLSLGVPEVKVMMIGAWKDRETMMIYIRRAGIDEAGATAGLSFIEPKEIVYDNVVNLFNR